MRRSISRLIYSVTLLSTLILAFEAPRVSAQEPDTSARVRAVHMVSDAPGVDLYLDDVSPAIFENVGYRAATRSLRITPGTHNVKVAANGTPKEAAFIDNDIDFGGDTAYAIVATGSLLSIDVQAVTLRRHASELPAPGSSFVRVLHASTGAPELDITINDVAGNDHTIENVSYRSASGFVTLPTGNARFDLTDPSGDTVFSASGIMPEGGVITLIASGEPASETFRLHVLLESDSTGRNPMDTLRAIRNVSDGTIRFAHVATDITGCVDLYVDDQTEPHVAGLARLSASRELLLAGGTHEFVVTRAGESRNNAILTREVEVIPGLYRSMFLIGSESSATIDVVTLTAGATSQPPPGQASVRFFNAREDTSVYDIELDYSAGGSRSILSSGFRNFTSYEPAAAGSATVTIDEQADEEPLMMTVRGELLPDVTSTLLFVNEGADPAVYRLDDTDTAKQSPMTRFETVTAVMDPRLPNSAATARYGRHNQAISIRFQDVNQREIGVRIYSISGGFVATAEHGPHNGSGRITIDAGGLPSGVYVVELTDRSGRPVWTSTVVVTQ